MTDPKSNPYAAPSTKLSSASASAARELQPRLSILRWMVIGFCWLFGGLAFSIGLLVMAFLVLLFLRDDLPMSLGEMTGELALCALYLGFGGAWLLAGRNFRLRNDLWGVVALLLGAAIPAILFVIIG